MAAAGSAIFYNLVPKGVVKLRAETGVQSWIFSPPKGWVASNLVALGSRIFFAGNAWSPCGPVYALQSDTGKTVWTKKYSSCGVWSDGQRLYLQGGNGDGDGVMAVDPATGDEIWHAQGKAARYVQTMVTHSGRIYTDDRVLDAETGKTLFWWPKDSDISGVAATDSVVLIGGYIEGHAGMLSAYNTKTLKKEWQSALLEGKHIVSIVAVGERIYAVGYRGSSTSSRDGVLQAFDSRTGQPEWSYQIYTSYQNLDVSPVSVGDNALFLVKPAEKKSGTVLVALNPVTGKPKWSFASTATLQGPAFGYGSRVYVSNSKEGLIALNATTGKTLWAYEP